jgi:hypothetical protein
MEADIEKLLDLEPVEVKKIPGTGVKVDGKLQQLYTIENGRHRIARAILEGKNDINVKINGGQKKRRKINTKKDKKHRKRTTRKNNK